MQTHFTPRTVALLMGGILTSAAMNSHSAGYAIIEQSASGMGNAYAGAAAVAEDASTIYFNPAGLTHLPGSQMVLAGHVIMPTADFSNRGSYANPLLTGGVPVAGSLPGPDDDGGETKFVPNFYFSSQISEKLFAGIGINAPFGLATKYDDDWVGRYHAIESEISTVNINPSLAWKVNDMFSLGAGISAQYIDATLSNAVDFGSVCFGLEGRGYLPPGSCSSAGVMPLGADGSAKVEGTDWSWGFNLGALVEFSDRTRVGLSYRSNIKQDLEGRANFRVPKNFQALLDMGIPLFTNTDAYASVDLPENVAISLYHAFNDQWAILADATWTHWTRFDELRIDYGNPMQPDTVQPENWDDSWRYSVGAIYRPNATWTFRAGWAFALGLGYQISKTMAVDLAYSHLFVDDTRMDALDHSTGHQLVGEYDSDVDIISAQLKMNF